MFLAFAFEEGVGGDGGREADVVCRIYQRDQSSINKDFLKMGMGGKLEASS